MPVVLPHFAVQIFPHSLPSGAALTAWASICLRLQPYCAYICPLRFYIIFQLVSYSECCLTQHWRICLVGTGWMMVAIIQLVYSSTCTMLKLTPARMLRDTIQIPFPRNDLPGRLYKQRYGSDCRIRRLEPGVSAEALECPRWSNRHIRFSDLDNLFKQYHENGILYNWLLCFFMRTIQRKMQDLVWTGVLALSENCRYLYFTASCSYWYRESCLKQHENHCRELSSRW